MICKALARYDERQRRHAKRWARSCWESFWAWCWRRWRCWRGFAWDTRRWPWPTGRCLLSAGSPKFPSTRASTARWSVTPPIQADEDNLVAGAQIYRDQCSGCHGFHGKPSSLAAHMFPDAPQLWEKHRHERRGGRERRSFGRDSLEGGEWHPPHRHACFQGHFERDLNLAGEPVAGKRR